MNCRKCGAKQITRRMAGVFSCAHCGVQPGPNNLDRGGNFELPKRDLVAEKLKFERMIASCSDVSNAYTKRYFVQSESSK